MQPDAIPTAPAAVPAIHLGRCDGCKHCRWIAPGGQLWRNDPRPQAQCSVFGNLDVTTNRHGDYVATVLPAGCPTHPGASKAGGGR